MTDYEAYLANVLDQCGEGYERDDGNWVDPLPFQKAVLEVAFKKSTRDEEFDIWTVVNPDANMVEGDTIAENGRRVLRSYKKQADGAVDEIESQITEWEQENPDKAPDELDA